MDNRIPFARSPTCAVASTCAVDFSSAASPKNPCPVFGHATLAPHTASRNHSSPRTQSHSARALSTMSARKSADTAKKLILGAVGLEAGRGPMPNVAIAVEALMEKEIIFIEDGELMVAEVRFRGAFQNALSKLRASRASRASPNDLAPPTLPIWRRRRRTSQMETRRRPRTPSTTSRSTPRSRPRKSSRATPRTSTSAAARSRPPATTSRSCPSRATTWTTRTAPTASRSR